MPADYNMDPLKGDARLAASALPPRDRQHMIETLLYPYPLFKEGVAFLEKFHRPVNGGRHGTGKLGGLMGVSRVGKSQICKFYAAGHPMRLDDDREVYPLVVIQATSDMKPKNFANQVCLATGARTLGAMNADALLQRAVDRLVQAKTELLIIDDAHFMIEGRRTDDARHFRTFLKTACDTSAFNILVVGEVSLKSFITATDFLHRRGLFPHQVLHPLEDSNDEFERFRILLDGIDNRLPFASKSGLSDPGIAFDVHRFSGGLIGAVMNLIQYAAYEAINESTAKIMPEHLRRAAKALVGLDDDYRYFQVVK
ncbi:TniB family NTP-binding protein [Rhizobium sp. BR 249]|uniref:TniB family NTP-binding protein n=1 Tax=Rhizobium sp. BR 249 TaxID=3040011 RepID=UPI0039BF0452